MILILETEYTFCFLIKTEIIVFKKSIIESLVGSVRHNYFYYSGNAI